MTDSVKYSIVNHKIKNFAYTHNLKYDDSSTLLKWYLTKEFNLSLQSTYEYITDGLDDKGVDALYHTAEDNTLSIHIIQSKLCTTPKSSQKNFPSNDLVKIKDFLNNLLNSDAIITENTALKRIHKTLIEKMSPYNDITITIHLLSNGEPLAPMGENIYNDLFAPYKDITTLKPTHLEYLYDKLNLSNNTKTGEVLISSFSPNNLLERLSGDVKAVVLTINAKDFVEIILCDDNKEIKKGIFDSNIRNYLTQNTSVNKDIEGTLSDENESPYFWFYNNGITIICDNLNYNYNVANKGIKLVNPQIINGAQTANNLYNIYKNPMFSKNLETADVLLKIVNKPEDGDKNKNFTFKITTATNNQNRVYQRDIKARDYIHIELEEFLLLKNIRYIRKRGDYDLQKDKSYKYFYILDIAQVVLAYILQSPHKSKTSSDKVFNDDKLYNSIFNSKLDKNMLVDGLNYFDLINKHINAIDDTFDKNLITHGKYMILYILSKLNQPLTGDLNNNIKNAIITYKLAYNNAGENKSFYTFSRSNNALQLIESTIRGRNNAPLLF